MRIIICANATAGRQKVSERYLQRKKNAVSIIVLFVQFVSSEMDEISVLIYTTHDYFRWRRVSHDAVPFLAWEKNNARKKGQLTFAEYLSFCFFCVNCCVGMCVIQTRKPPKTTIFYHIPVGFFRPGVQKLCCLLLRAYYSTACLQIRGSAGVFPVSEE